MTWGCTTHGRTPAMIRTNYDRATHSAPTLPDTAARPARVAASDDGGDGFGEWLAHLDAGRIAVR
jgi:hypothetical protein